MPKLDLNLLIALDVLLHERSVTAAARELGLSTSAMSRTLSRLRSATGDALLVPAGRAMVPTPHALEIAAEVHALVGAAQKVLSTPPELDIRELQRDFTIRANAAFVFMHAARLSTMVMETAPGVRLRFAAKPEKEIHSLRHAIVDLEIGVISGDGAELRAQTLYRDSFVGIVHSGHPLLMKTPVSVDDYVAWPHVVASRRGSFTGPIDDALAKLGLARNVNVVVPSFPSVIAVAAESDLIGLIPRSYCRAGLAAQTEMFELPVSTPEVTVSQIWHPRMDADPGHRWLRGLIFDAFRS